MTTDRCELRAPEPSNSGWFHATKLRERRGWKNRQSKHPIAWLKVTGWIGFQNEAAAERIRREPELVAATTNHPSQKNGN
jgi:hypothetical protein